MLNFARGLPPPHLIVLAFVAVALLVFFLTRWPAPSRPKPTRKADPVLLRLGSAPGDVLTMHQAMAGVIAVGMTGSGKTTVMSHLMAGIMRQMAGMLILTAKGDDYAGIERIAKEEGRLGDLIRFAPGSLNPQGQQWAFDFLDEELRSPGGSIATTSQLMQDMLDTATKTQAANSSDPFWHLASARSIRMAITLIWKAQGRCSVTDVYKFISSLPPSEAEGISPEVAQVKRQQWRGNSYCAQCMLEAVEKVESDPDLEMACDYVMSEYVRMSERTSGSINANTYNLLEKFLTGEVRDLIAGSCTNVSPQDVLNGKIVVVDVPALTYREPGQFVQLAWKLAMIRAALRRDVRKNPRPVCIWADEAQLHAVPSVDSMTQAVARSHKLINVSITQNLNLLQSVIRSKEETLAWVSNMVTKLIFANSDKETNNYFADLFGKSLHLFGGLSGGTRPYDAMSDLMGLDQQQGNYNLSPHWHWDVPADCFTRLRKGGEENDFMVDAYVFRGGKTFSTGKTWLRTGFRQRL